MPPSSSPKIRLAVGTWLGLGLGLGLGFAQLQPPKIRLAVVTLYRP